MSPQPPRRANALSWVLPFILAFAAAGASVAAPTAPTAPVTTVLPAVADTTIRQQQANQNRAIDEQTHLGWAQGSRALVRFDPAVIAATVGTGTLVSAHLELDVVATGESWPAASQNVEAHRVTAAWTETGATWSCGIDAKPGDNHADCAPLWNGGSFLASPTATVPHTKTTLGPVRFDVTADVAAFLAGTPNQGWLLKKANEALSGRIDYAAKESPTPEKAPRLVLVVEPRTGNDTTPPTLAFTEPAVPVLQDQPSPRVRLDYSDTQSGIDAASLRLFVEEQDVTSTCTVGASSAVCQLPVLTTAASGVSEHRLEARILDRAGNASTATLTLLLLQGQGDLAAPQVLLTSPTAGVLVNQQPITVSGMVLDDGVVQLLSVNGIPATFDGSTFTTNVPLSEGENLITVRATDGSGKSGEASVTVTLDATPPLLQVLAPVAGATTNADTLTVEGTAVDRSGINQVTVEGVPVPLVDGAFAANVPLAGGDHTIVVTAVDSAGNTTTESRAVSRFTLPRVVITVPADLSSTTSNAIKVEGTVEGTGVAVNGVTAQVTGNSFVATDVPLLAGPNLVTAVVTDVAGHAATSTITVLRDVSAPRLAVAGPSDGAVVFDATIAVHGLVSDHGEGALDAPPPAVTVNGVTATVANETFLAPAVPLAPGANTLTVVATDGAGNQRQVTLTVRRDSASGQRVQVVSGNLQSAEIGTTLPAPLVVQVVDAAGLPVAGRPVLFATSNDGSFPGGMRQTVVTTDGAGRSSTPFTLGMRSGAGNQIVEASVAGFAPAVFTLTALPAAPALIVADVGDQQVGVAGQRLPVTLAAAVIDTGSNRRAGVAVRFEVVAGGGSFADGGSETVVETDHLGRAVVALTLGSEEGIGNNVVEATVVGSNPPIRTSFTATGRIAGDPEATSISGVVLDNTNQPVPGVTIRLFGTTITAVTDYAGLFRIAPAPVATVKMIVDGSTATRPGTWPDLEFVFTTVPGRDNTVNMPIYLLPLELGSSKLVDETHGATITLPDFPGFALDVAPGSVTFPGGSRSGTINVTVVHTDRVPMIPNFGQQPRFIVTIQPAGAQFEPPARLTLPNLDGLAPGAVTEMYSFDHDLGRFVSIGLATVSDDGTVLISNPGAGVRKAGWHCGGPPSGSGTPHDCPTCRQCVNERCVPDNGQTPPPGPTGDCNSEICWQGRPASIWDPGDPPQPTPGDCRKEICLVAPGGSDLGPPPPGFPAKVTDTDDPPAGRACCGFNGSPLPPGIYNPQTECCTPLVHRVVSKHPMPLAWPVECPNRVPFQGHVPEVNGCTNIPDNPSIVACLGASFEDACNNHDICYDTCNANKAGCDAQFLVDMLEACSRAIPINPDCHAICAGFATTYATAVANIGFPFYYAAQRNACQCCP